VTTPPDDDEAPTGYAPTELGAAIDETEARKAWALADECLTICHNCTARG